MDCIGVEFWVMTSVIWVAGFVRELAVFHRNKLKMIAPYPSRRVKYMVPVILLLAWPYFYFYGE